MACGGWFSVVISALNKFRKADQGFLGNAESKESFVIVTLSSVDDPHKESFRQRRSLELGASLSHSFGHIETNPCQHPLVTLPKFFEFCVAHIQFPERLVQRLHRFDDRINDGPVPIGRMPAQTNESSIGISAGDSVRLRVQSEYRGVETRVVSIKEPKRTRIDLFIWKSCCNLANGQRNTSLPCLLDIRPITNAHLPADFFPTSKCRQRRG
jgi:hypothetical protein